MSAVPSPAFRIDHGLMQTPAGRADFGELSDYRDHSEDSDCPDFREATPFEVFAFGKPCHAVPADLRWFAPVPTV